ncbi:MAG: YicC/YloC family endoribonuclease [Salibacteraceae bacterium]
MLKSMTGFGKALGNRGEVSYNVELRSLNSKQTDIYVRMPNHFKSKELDIRTLLTKSLSRGKIELSLNIHGSTAESVQTINVDLAKHYHQELKNLAGMLSEKTDDLLPMVLKMPEVLANKAPELDTEEWDYIVSLIEEAIERHSEFREVEGKSLEDDFKVRIDAITRLLTEIESYEDVRVESVRDRLNKGIESLSQTENLDKNRHEQEIIYYIEKLDINEEKVRLNAHLKYFVETMNGGGTTGKKLGFITQEMGREINTLGSKAYHQDIQKLVVQMKDELEKIKEQVLNVL